MDGWETLAALRRINPELPAILSSGYEEAHAMNGDYKELPQAFLHKPYSMDDLQNSLNQVLTDAATEGRHRLIG
jgi:two-component system, cell cycle sensor histidine kinase and response regulator CckA